MPLSGSDAADGSGRHRVVAAVVLGAIALTLSVELFAAAPAGVVARLLDGLGVRPPLNVAMAAYQAGQTCDVGAGDAGRGALVLLAQAYLATGAGAPSLARGASPFGVYRNPLAGVPGYDVMRGAGLLRIDAGALAPGGNVVTELGLGGGLAPRDWSSLGTVDGEHGLGFLLIRPSQWLAWIQGPSLSARLGADRRARLDPYEPLDAFLVMACHVRDVEHAAGTGLTQALTTIGGGVAQLWTDVEGALPDVRDQVAEASGGGTGEVIGAASALEADALAGLGLSASRIGTWYVEQVDRFLSGGAGETGDPGTTRWPQDPPPLPLGHASAMPMPSGAWYPAVSIQGFVNPFPDTSQCTWFAYQAYAAFNGEALIGLVGDAGDWISEALASPRLRARVITPGMDGFGPVEGAVVSFARTPTMPYGHVAIVRAVARDAGGALWMLLWDANWDLRGGRTQHWERWSTWAGRVAGLVLPPPARSTGASTSAVRTLIDQAFAGLGPAAQQWGQRIASCESSDDPRAVDPQPVGAEHAQGLFQFLPSTFAGTPPGRAGADIFDPRASADAAAWMYSQGRQAEWQCN